MLFAHLMGNSASCKMDIAERIAKDQKLLDLLGIRPGTIDEGSVTLHLSVRENFVNARGFCHGGIVFTLADTACAYALGSVGVSPATVDANITYLRPAVAGDEVLAHAKVIRAGGRMGHCQVDVVRSDDTLLASYRGSCVNLPRDKIGEFDE